MSRFPWAVGVLLLGVGLAPVHGDATEDAQKKIQGAWTAKTAEVDGKPAAEYVGHVLTFTGDKFKIDSKDGKLLYAGTFKLNAQGKPAEFDFAHAEGALKGKTWKGIFSFDGDTLRTCDNGPDPAKARPTAFETKAGSGHILMTFQRVKP